MATTSKKRKKVLVEKQIQGSLVLRSVLYWFFCLCTILLFVAVGTVFSGKLQSGGELSVGIWRQYSPAVLASVFLLPLIALDIIRLSHRFVGPLIRLQNEMKRLADGQQVNPIVFRKRDHWHGLADQFNRLALQHQQLSEPADELDTTKEVERESVVGV